MLCPKCNKESSSDKECSYCGIIFAKYHQRQKTVETDVAPAEGEPAKTSRGAVWGSIAAVLCIVLVAAYIFHGRTHGGSQSAAVDGAPQGSTDVGNADSAKTSDSGESIRKKLQASFPPKNSIENARNATVYIKTAWGVFGSGFFIDDRCRVVTNRHVVKVKDEELQQAAKMRDEAGVLIQREKAYLDQLRSRPTDNAAIREAIDERQKKLDAVTAQFDIWSAMIDKAGMNDPSDVKLVLIDGTELPVENIQLSEKYDLALLSATCADSPSIEKGDLVSLAQGQRLYTIGSPEGLKFSVTSGIFSGWQDINEVHVLQTDAPINPGNSGGPLIAENGKVLGVNTMVLRAARNIGFALPIDRVYNEFPEAPGALKGR